MIRAEALLSPGVWVTAVAAATHVALKPNFVSLVVPLLKALLTDNAGSIKFASLTLPGHVASFECLSTDSLA